MVYLRSSFSAAKIAEWGARGKGDMPILANGGELNILIMEEPQDGIILAK